MSVRLPKCRKSSFAFIGWLRRNTGRSASGMSCAVRGSASISGRKSTERFERIAGHPQRWPLFRDRYRRVRLRRFPYMIYYHVADSGRILYTRARPSQTPTRILDQKGNQVVRDAIRR